MPVENIFWWPLEFLSINNNPIWNNTFEAQISAQTVYAVPIIQHIKWFPGIIGRGQFYTGTNFEVNAYVVSYTTADGAKHPGGQAIWDTNVDSVTFGWWVAAFNTNPFDVNITFQIFGWG